MTIYKGKNFLETIRGKYLTERENLKKARIEWEAVHSVYKKELDNAREALEDFLVDNPDKEITLKEAAVFSGLAPSTARDFLQKESSRSWSPLERNTKNITRKFVYLDENGVPDMNNVCESTKKLVVYSKNTRKE